MTVGHHERTELARYPPAKIHISTLKRPRELPTSGIFSISAAPVKKEGAENRSGASSCCSLRARTREQLRLAGPVSGFARCRIRYTCFYLPMLRKYGLKDPITRQNLVSCQVCQATQDTHRTKKKLFHLYLKTKLVMSQRALMHLQAWLKPNSHYPLALPS